MLHLLFSVTVPTIPVDTYGNAILAHIETIAVGPVLTYASAVTLFVVALNMVVRWLGHADAISVMTGSISGRQALRTARGERARRYREGIGGHVPGTYSRYAFVCGGCGHKSNSYDEYDAQECSRCGWTSY